MQESFAFFARTPPAETSQAYRARRQRPREFKEGQEAHLVVVVVVVEIIIVIAVALTIAEVVAGHSDHISGAESWWHPTRGCSTFL